MLIVYTKHLIIGLAYSLFIFTSFVYSFFCSWSISFIDSFTMSRWQISETTTVYKCLCHLKDYGIKFYMQSYFPSESLLEVFYFFFQGSFRILCCEVSLLLFLLAPSECFNLLCFDYGNSLILLCIALPSPSPDMKHLLLNKCCL